MKTIFSTLMVVCVMFLSACGGQSLSYYKNSTPPLKLEEFFNGPIKAWGVLQNHKGEVTRRFDIDMVGTWNGNVGTLTEHFNFYDGEKQTRVWTITKNPDGTYSGTASDILDQATGAVEGSAAQWKYVMDLPVGDKTYRITFDDWMYQMNDDVLVNRSYLKKFGFTVAELTIFMQKQK